MEIHEGEVCRVVMLPFPAQGHVNPMMRLACRLASLGFHSIFACNSRFVSSALGCREDCFQEMITIVEIDRGSMPDSEWRGNVSSVDAMERRTAEMEKPFQELVRETMKSAHVPCIISDNFLDWSQDVADRVGIPRVILWTSSTATCIVSFLLGKLIRDGYIPVEATLESRGNVLIPGIPGLSGLRVNDLPLSYHHGDVSQFGKRVNIFGRFKDAACILANTFESLEVDAIAGVRSLLPNFFPVGPLVPDSVFKTTASAGAWREDRHCLDWLDEQMPSSVTYVSFGSLANISAAQVEELARGLEASDVKFLWVIRPTLVDGLVDSRFFEGFVERTRTRGMVISWAPQLQVLGHKSVSLFLTHCGWNSVMEGICSGVPLLAWPCFAEQNLNAKYVEEWGIGRGFRKSESSRLVESEEIVSVIVGAAKDEEMRRKVKKIMVDASNARKEVDSMNKFIKSFLRHPTV